METLEITAQRAADRYADNSTTIDVVVSRRTIEADGIISLELVARPAETLPAFSAGAHIDVYVANNIVRQYSLCNSSHEKHRYVLGIQLEPNSRGGSVGVHKACQVGSTVKIGRPRNNFGLIAHARRFILLAGGIGITPLLSMAHTLSADDADFELHYCARSLARMAFREQLNDPVLAERVFLHSDDDKVASPFTIARALPPPDVDTHIYICGPQGFMDHVKQETRRLGWSPENIHVEYFSRSTETMTGDGFLVRAERSGAEFFVGPDQTIANVLRDNNVQVELSCEQGICGTCITGVLEGTPEHRDMYLSDEEKTTNNKIMICCSRALSAKLVLDI